MKTILWLVGLTLLVAPFVQAHGAAAPRPQDTRLLHDHNDDCGGDGITSNCRGTLDLIALDVQEFWDGTEKVRFRLTMDQGQSGSHKLTFSYDSSAAGKKSFDITSSDQVTFSGGFDQLSVSSANDGSRFILDAVTTSEKAGLPTNAKLSNFRVEARRDNTLGDFMPGGYQGPLGAVQDPAQGDGPTNYVKPDYLWRGPGYYTIISGPNAEGVGEKATTVLKIINALDAAQTVTLRLTSTAGTATFTNGATEKVIDVARKGSVDVEIQAKGASEGQIVVTATTNLGGWMQRDRAFTIEPGMTSTPTTAEPVDSTTDATSSEGAPALTGTLVAVGMLALVAARRRW